MPKLKVGVGRSNKEQRAVLDHLIAIGEATNQTRWPDDLTDIRGIGSQVAARMAGVGITSFSDLAGISDHAKSQLTRGDTFKRFEKRLDAWIDEASKRASEPRLPEADTYLGVVRSCAGGWTDAEGTVRRKLTSKSGNTRMVTFDLFDAPEGHRRSENLAKSLRAVVGAGIGFGEHARIPKLYQRHVDELRLMRNTLDGGRTLSKDDLERLNDVVAGSTLELGHPDEYQSVDELMRGGCMAPPRMMNPSPLMSGSILSRQQTWRRSASLDGPCTPRWCATTTAPGTAMTMCPLLHPTAKRICRTRRARRRRRRLRRRKRHERWEVRVPITPPRPIDRTSLQLELGRGFTGASVQGLARHDSQ